MQTWFDRWLSIWTKVTLVTFCVVMAFEFHYLWPAEVFWTMVFAPLLICNGIGLVITVVVGVVVAPIWLIKSIWRAV